MSPAEQFAHLILWLTSGVLMTSFLDIIWCRFQRVSKRTRTRWFPWVMGGGILSMTLISLYMTVEWAEGQWRIYDVLAQFFGGFLYVSHLKGPIRSIGKVGDFFILRPVWWVVHLLVTMVRLIVRFLVRIIALLYRMTYKPFRKIFPSTLQSRPKFIYTRGNRRMRRNGDESKSKNQSTGTTDFIH